jgi:pilus assembly protein CpaC
MVMTCKKLLYAGIAAAITAAIPGAALAAPTLVKNQTKAGGHELLSTGKSIKVDLPAPISDVIVGNPDIADVQVRSPRQIWIFGKKPGDTTVSATDASGRVVFQKTIRVAPNVDSIEEIFQLAMPDADIRITPMAGGYLLTGSVANPEDIDEAGKLAEYYVNAVALNGAIGGEVKVFNRLSTATPLQVNLQVRIAEVSRSLAKEIGSNFTTRDANGNGFVFGIGRGRVPATITNNANPLNLPVINACTAFALPQDCGLALPFNPQTQQFLTNINNVQYNFTNPAGSNVLNLAGKLFGLDVAAAFDLAERAGLSSTLANPNLTALSGETGEFLAGGSFPIPVSDSFGSISVQQQTYGINLRYTPNVLADGRIRLQLRTEVSDITSQGAVRIGGTEIPALLTRMADTTVELGSGQSFMIAGLLSNQASSSVDKYPGLGDVPVVGSLFKSNGWRRNQTELVIVVTPYLVNPVSESEIVLPTDGYNTPSDLERILLNKDATNISGQAERPKPTVAPEAPQGPSLGSISDNGPALAEKPQKAGKKTAAKADGPGFTFE